MWKCLCLQNKRGKSLKIDYRMCIFNLKVDRVVYRMEKKRNTYDRFKKVGRGGALLRYNGR
jgi:hypothetical protein